MMTKKVCLKIDVDTYVGTQEGVPVLLDILQDFGIKATFFVSLGPDNSGKALKNIFLQKGFLRKMLRTKAWKLYGFQTIFSGILFPPRIIGEKCADVLRSIKARNHEVGIHAWDHRKWQDNLDRMTEAEIKDELSKAFNIYEKIYSIKPKSSAAPAWYCNGKSLSIIDSFNFIYSSDTRGNEPFFPLLKGSKFNTLQIPTNQPCVEELLTEKEATEENVYNILFNKLRSETVNILPIHAEVEGGIFRHSFRQFLEKCKQSGYEFSTLENYVLDLDKKQIIEKEIIYKNISGRSAVVAFPS